MSKARSSFALVGTAVALLLATATVFLLDNFGATPVAKSWPAIALALSLAAIFFGFLELGLALLGVFAVPLLANLDLIWPFEKSWPLILIWLALVLVFGFLRARRRGRGGP